MSVRLRVCWPITDSWALAEDLRARAAEQVDAIAAERGAAPDGPVEWRVQNGLLIGEAPARPFRRPLGAVPYGWVEKHVPLVRVLAEVRGHPDRVIADILGCTESAVAKARGKHHIAAGVGNPTLAGYVPPVLGGQPAAA